MKRSLREQEFSFFGGIVQDHIANYTIPQYGDAPTDELETWTAEQCVKSIGKYVARFESGRRGKLETLRDLVKISHFAAVAFSKLGASGEDIRKIREGKA